MNEETKNAIIDLRDQGYSIREIAQKLGMPKTQIGELLKGISSPKPRNFNKNINFQQEYTQQSRQIAPKMSIEDQIIEIERMKAELKYVKFRNAQLENILTPNQQLNQPQKPKEPGIFEQYKKIWLDAERQRMFKEALDR